MVTLFKKSKFFWNICIYAQILLEFRVVSMGLYWCHPILACSVGGPSESMPFSKLIPNQH